MNKVLLTVLVGAAVAGVVYYLLDEEGAKKLATNIKDAATDAYDKVSESLGKAKNQAADAMPNA